MREPDTLFLRWLRASAVGPSGPNQNRQPRSRRARKGDLKMKRFEIPLASLLCLALWACVQPMPAPPPAPPGPPLAVTSVRCGDGSDLLTHVQYVQLLPQPNTDFTYTADTTMIDPAIQRDLAAAFSANPAFSKNEL